MGLMDDWIINGAPTGGNGGGMFPSDAGGGLLGDPELLKRLLAQYQQAMQPTAEERQQAHRDKWLTTGLGILSAPGGNLAGAIGRGGLLGMQAGQQSLADAQKQRLQALQMMPMLQGLGDDQRYRQAALDWAKQRQQGQPGQPAAPMAPQEPQQLSGPGMPSLPPNVPMLPSTGMTPGAGVPRLSANKMSDYQTAIAKAQFYEQQGLPPKYVEAAFAQAEKLRPELKETKTLTDPNTNQRVTVNFYKDGTHEVVPLGPDQEKAHFLDTGSQVGAVDPFTGKPIAGGGLYNKTMTPGETASNKLGYARLGFEQGQANKPQFNAESGLWLSPPRAGQAQPAIAQPDYIPKDTTPATIKEKIAQNNVTVKLIDDAIGAVGKSPGAFGAMNTLPDAIQQRIDPSGVAVRAAVANIGSQKFHDRSGANITASEAPRLQPFIPSSTDPPEAVITKLRGMRKEAALMNTELQKGLPLTQVAGSNRGGSGGWSIQEVK